MVDLKEKSREEIFREKKEAELREAKRRAAMKNALSITDIFTGWRKSRN